MQVNDVKAGGEDNAGNPIDKVYTKNAPDYAIYQSLGQVLVHLADDPDRAKAQAVALAPLGVLRGEIDGLIDGWRNKRKRQSKVAALQLGIFRALSQALQGDIAGARQSLEEIKQGILSDRTAVARFEYMMVAASCFLAIVVLTELGLIPKLVPHLYPAADPEQIRIGVSAGALGAFFSIATGLRNRTVLPDLHYLDNAADALLRMLIGAIGAGAALALYDVGLVHLELPKADDGGLSGSALFVIGFLAGFSERLVPDLLAKTAQAIGGAGPGGAPPITAATADAAAQLTKTAPASAATDTPKSPDTDSPAGDSAKADGAPDDQDGCADKAPDPDSVATKDEDLPEATGGLAAPVQTPGGPS